MHLNAQKKMRRKNWEVFTQAFRTSFRTRECNQETIFALLHNLDNEVEVKTINTRVKAEGEDIVSEQIAQFQVVKDHDNEAVGRLTSDSNRFCFCAKLAEMTSDWSSEEVHTAFGDIDQSLQLQASCDLTIQWDWW